MLCGSKVNCVKLGRQDKAIILVERGRLSLSGSTGSHVGRNYFRFSEFLACRPVSQFPNGTMCRGSMHIRLCEAHNDSVRGRNLASGRSLIPSV